MAYHFGLIKVSDLVQVNMKGEIVGGNRVSSSHKITRVSLFLVQTCVSFVADFFLPYEQQACINNAGFNIHAALHDARPDVNAACHFHSLHGKAWSCFGRPLEMLNQDACTFYRDHAVYDAWGGIAFEAAEGLAIARALGGRRCAILKNHGLLTTGQTVDEAAFLFTLMENSCRVQLLAEAAAASGIRKHICPDQEAEYTYRLTTPEAMWLEFQPDYQYELKVSGGDFLN